MAASRASPRLAALAPYRRPAWLHPSREDQAIDAAWREWLRLRVVIDRGGNRTPAEDSALYDRWLAAEHTIEAAPPSAMRGAAVILINLFWGMETAPGSVQRSDGDSGWAMMHVLPCFRPGLTGSVALAVDRMFATPDKPWSDTLTMLADEREAA